MYTFTPAFVINAFVPIKEAPFNELHQWIFQQMAGAFLMMSILQTVLLRSTNDLKVWKIFEGAVLAYDWVMLASIYDTLRLQGRLQANELRGEEWGSIAITALAVVVRSAFVLGVGVPSQSKRVKKA